MFNLQGCGQEFERFVGGLLALWKAPSWLGYHVRYESTDDNVLTNETFENILFTFYIKPAAKIMDTSDIYEIEKLVSGVTVYEVKTKAELLFPQWFAEMAFIRQSIWHDAVMCTPEARKIVQTLRPNLSRAMFLLTSENILEKYLADRFVRGILA